VSTSIKGEWFTMEETTREIDRFLLVGVREKKPSGGERYAPLDQGG